MQASAAIDLIDRFHRTFLPADELQKRVGMTKLLVRREAHRRDPGRFARLARLAQDLADLERELDHFPEAAKAQQRAIRYWQQALDLEQDRTQSAWLQAQLGNAWRNLPTGDHAANVRQAIAYFEAALQVRTRAAFPVDWAMTQNNLGNAWSNLPTGDHAANLRQAIACYEAALEVWAREAFPVEWAITQNNLGIAWVDVPTGDVIADLERAAGCYELALEVLTSEAFPELSAAVQDALVEVRQRLDQQRRSQPAETTSGHRSRR
jgi:tetratricopeptide (TPR) repeat protein